MRIYKSLLIVIIIGIISCKEKVPQNKKITPLIVTSNDSINIKLSKIVNIGTLNIQDKTGKIDNNTAFRINQKPKKITLCFLLANDAMSIFYIYPDKEVSIAVERENNNKINFIFDKNDLINNFTNSFHKQIIPLFSDTLTEKQLLISIKKVEQKSLNQLKEIKSSIDPISYKVLKSMITGKLAHIKFIQAERFKHLSANLPYYDFVDTIKFDDDNYLTYSDNLNTVLSVLSIQYERKFNQPFESAGNKFEFIDSTISNKEVKSAIISFVASRQIPEQSEEEKEILIKELSQIPVKDYYINYLKNIEASTATGTKIGNKAKYFETLTPYDKDFSLNQLNGKIVYVDNWATWCGPCMKSMKHFKAKQYQLIQMDNVVFVFVSFDRNENIWRNYVANSLNPNQNIIHLFNGMEMSTKYGKYYNITGLPNYFIIDKQGLIYDNNPKTPSDENFISYLKQFD